MNKPSVQTETRRRHGPISPILNARLGIPSHWQRSAQNDDLMPYLEVQEDMEARHINRLLAVLGIGLLLVAAGMALIIGGYVDSVLNSLGL